MPALSLGRFQGLLSQNEFKRKVNEVGSAAEDGKVAGFIAQRHGGGLHTYTSDVAYAGDEANKDRTFELIPEDALNNLGAYVVGRPLPDNHRGFATFVPTQTDMETFCNLQVRSPGVINGITIPLLLGGSAVFFFRASESESQPFDPDRATALPLPELHDSTHLADAFGSVGLNWTMISYDGSSPFRGLADPLFEGAQEL